METQIRRMRVAQTHDQENVYAGKGKHMSATGNLPVKRQGLGVRGVLGEVNSNVQVQRDLINLKGLSNFSECDKKSVLSRNTVKSNYSHVQSKVDTGRLLKAAQAIQPAARPPLRREESTAILAARAVARTKIAVKETQSNKVEEKKKEPKEKKPVKLQPIKERLKVYDDKVTAPRQLVKEPISHLKKLTLVDEDVAKDSDSDSCSLPSDIEDIDADDGDSPLLLSMYIKDIYRYLIELEQKYPIEQDHLKNQTEITGKMRSTLLDWLVDVQKQFSLLLETFQLTVGIIDRYLQVMPNIKRSQLQLVGVTAMFIASKYEEIYAPDISDFVYVTDNAYTKQEIFRCERDIICKLGFCFARPVPLSFLRRFVKAANGSLKIHHLAKYFADLSLIEYSMSHYRPSEIAAASVCLSLYLLSRSCFDDVWTPTMVYYSGYPLTHLEPIVKKIALLVSNVEKSKNKAVYNKYLEPSLAKVSGLPQLKGPAMHQLIKTSP